MKKQFALMAILSLVAAVGIKLYEGSSLQDPVALSGTLGSAVGFLVLGLGVPGLPAGVYWLLKKRVMPGFAQYAWSVWALSVAASAYVVTVPLSGALGQTYSPPHCDFTVDLPGTPKITAVVLPGIGEIPRAQYVGGSDQQHGYILRVECFPMTADQINILDNKETLLQQSMAYAKANGITNPEFKYERTRLGSLVTIRGFKTIGGIPATYEVHQYLGKQSMLSIYAGGPSSHYPQQGVTEFFASVQASSIQ